MLILLINKRSQPNMNKILDLILYFFLILIFSSILILLHKSVDSLYCENDNYYLYETTNKEEPFIIIPTWEQIQQIVDSLPNYLSDEQKEKCLNKIIDKEIRETKELIQEK